MHTRLAPVVCATLLLALYGVTLPTPAAGATYYVSTTGNDIHPNPCTAAQTVSGALRTISLAVACAGPGDTVQVGPGVFFQRVDVNVSPGGSAAGGPVTIQGTLPLGSTVLDGTGLGNGWMIYGRHVAYVTIRHFEIRGHIGGGIGFFGHTQHVAVTDNYVHDNTFLEGQGSGVRVTTRFSTTTNRVQGAEIGTASHITIARNRLKNIVTGFMGNLPNSGSESLTVAADISYFVIEDNEIDNGQFIGIDLIGKTAAWWGIGGFQTLPIPATPWPRYGIVRRNTVKNLKKGFGASDVGIYCDGCRDIVFEQNRVDTTAGYCYAISTEENGFLIDQIIVRYNVGIGCPSAIYMVGPPQNQFGHGVSDHLRIAHNTALKTKPGGPVFRFFFTQGARFLNNIGAVASATPVPYLSHAANVASAAPLLDYNLYWGGTNFEYKGFAYTSFSASQAGSGQDAHGLVADPRFTNVATRDLTLQAGSPAIDRGTPLTLTVGAGSGMLVTVQDARFFSDGYGMVLGDVVQIGSQVARVTQVDYATNRLTLDRTLSWGANAGVSYPFSGAAPDLGACEGASCEPPAPPPPITPPSVALDLKHTCGTPSNALHARVMGSLLYLAADATYQAETLARSSCASNVMVTDSASVLPSSFSLLPPWQFLGTAGPNTGNACTNCLAVHGGTPSVNQAGSGYTLTTFQQGTSVSAATGGVSAFTALPGLCRQVVDGGVTSTPLWPWPMEARIAAARSLAGRLPVNVTTTVAAALGPIPPACLSTPPPGPPDYTSALRMHLKFDEGTLTTAQDSTANNHDGTLGSGATWGPAKLGTSAVVLDGTPTGTVTVTGTLGNPSAVTLAAWVKPSGFPTDNGEIISLGNYIALRVSAVRVSGFYYTGTTWLSTHASVALGTTTWAHLAYIFTPGSQKVYVNGTLIASTNTAGPLSWTGLGNTTMVGAHGDGLTTQRYQGTIDDVRVYTRALSDNDIVALSVLEVVNALKYEQLLPSNISTCP